MPKNNAKGILVHLSRDMRMAPPRFKTLRRLCNNVTNLPRFSGKIEKFRPLPEPIRLHDLQNSARSRTEKKQGLIFHFSKLSLIHLPVKISSKVKYLSLCTFPSSSLAVVYVNWPQTNPGMECKTVTRPFLQPRNRDSLHVEVKIVKTRSI